MLNKIFGIFLVGIFLILSFSVSSVATVTEIESSKKDRYGISIWIECYGLMAQHINPNSYTATITVTNEQGGQTILTDEDSWLSGWPPVTKTFGIATSRGEYNVHCKIDGFKRTYQREEDVLVDGNELVYFGFTISPFKFIHISPFLDKFIRLLDNIYLER